jgi:hypothetical protein
VTCLKPFSLENGAIGTESQDSVFLFGPLKVQHSFRLLTFVDESKVINFSFTKAKYGYNINSISIFCCCWIHILIKYHKILVVNVFGNNVCSYYK